MVGGFLGVVNETGALDVGIASIVKKYKGREKMLIVIFNAFVCSAAQLMVWVKKNWLSITLLVPVMMAVGFDSLTAVAIILLVLKLDVWLPL